MIIFLVCIALSYFIFNDAQLSKYDPVFWFESLALWAFGYSWLTKGKLFWKDVQNNKFAKK